MKLADALMGVRVLLCVAIGHFGYDYAYFGHRSALALLIGCVWFHLNIVIHTNDMR